ncbi:hypothetical protein GKC33_00815 [Lactobacillus salivarius]|uniref:Uncharacterized protein n=1 Tax=Ligilactobacillus salivarius TaxID=1624 RepID=A0A6A8LMB2_9LACO|nr:hypothetical protein [Ligilactobacillus salivarius]MSE07040.1 hypothetical protein [Ligilactobacillus salivarius]MSE07305.1 hypothetical protein [Ligilactobacillus salivarius]
MKLKQKLKALQEKKKRLSAKKRKERTKRLIEKGVIVEKLQGIDAENIKPENTQEWLINNLTDLTDHFTGELPAEFFEYNILQKELDDLKQKVNSLNNENQKLKYELEEKQKKYNNLVNKHNEINKKFTYFSKIAGTLSVKDKDQTALEVIKDSWNRHNKNNN